MAHYQTPRPAPQAKPKPLTEEERKNKILQFLAQKREAFAINILNGLCHNLKDNTPMDVQEDVVDIAVKMADKLMEKLYPMPETPEENKEESK